MQVRTTVAIRAILRGAFWGFVVSFITNNGTWHCLLREETLEELIDRIPDHPFKYPDGIDTGGVFRVIYVPRNKIQVMPRESMAYMLLDGLEITNPYTYTACRVFRKEPEIPINFLRNLSKQEIEERGEILVLLRPWKVLQDLDMISSPADKHSIIFLWKVGVSDAKLRFIARATIGSISMINDKRITVMFVTGFWHHRSQKLLSQENEQFGDILAFNVPGDTQIADSQLVLAAFKWTAEQLSDLVEHVVTTHNRELMPFIPAIVDFIEQGNISRDAIVCSRVTRPEPRPSNPKTSDYVKASSYNSSYFPSHCQSDLVILKREMMWKIQELGRKTIAAEIPSEIYLWGVLREKLRRNDEKNIVSYEESMKQTQAHVMSYPILYNHFKAAAKAKEMWNEMQQEFTSEHRDNKIRVTYRHPMISNNEKGNLISKESAIFIKKWSRP